MSDTERADDPAEVGYFVGRRLLVTRAHVCWLLSVESSVVDELVRSGELPRVWLAGIERFEPRDLIRLVERCVDRGDRGGES